jgi:NifU-like N terminal domain
MTATCREACCSVTPRLTVSELVERGLRRNRAAPLALAGPRLTDADGNTAAFSVDVTNASIAAVGFRVTSCATLIAYSEFIAASSPGLRLDMANALTAADLAARVDGIPAPKRTRALLAVAAFRAAVAVANERVEPAAHLDRVSPS